MPVPGSDCPYGGKEQFTREGARERASVLRGRGVAERSLRAYRCECGCYHLGNRGKSKKETRRRRAGRR